MAFLKAFVRLRLTHIFAPQIIFLPTAAALCKQSSLRWDKNGFLRFLHKKIPHVRDRWQNSESWSDEISFDHRRNHFTKKTADLSIITPFYPIKISYMLHNKNTCTWLLMAS